MSRGSERGWITGGGGRRRRWKRKRRRMEDGEADVSFFIVYRRPAC
jgi:hypothetical protein